MNRRTALAGLIGVVCSPLGFLGKKKRKIIGVDPGSEGGSFKTCVFSAEICPDISDCTQWKYCEWKKHCRGNATRMPKKEWIGKWPGE